MKKRIGILALCVCLVLAGCASNTGNTPDLTKSVTDSFDPEKELNVLYSVSPYSQLLPRELPEGFAISGYYLNSSSDVSQSGAGENYVVDYSNVLVNRFASLSFSNGADIKFNIQVIGFGADWGSQTMIDPDDPETYTNAVFRAEDLTAELIEAKIGKFVPEEHCSFSVKVLCGDWQVSYRGSYYGKNLQDWPVSAQQLYDMITSSLYYTGEGEAELEAGPAILDHPSLAELEVTQEERDALYAIAPYDQLVPRQLLEEYVVIGVQFITGNDGKTATLVLQNKDGIQIEITVNPYWLDKDVVADPNDPKTYDSLWYSQQSEKPKGTYSNGLFHAKDITPGLIEARMGTFVPGKPFKFRVAVLCDDYVVSYQWYPTNKEYPEELPISALQMLQMITSARYFTE